jgi:NACHT domain
VLRDCPRLLIEGRAGGGKTTLLQWIGVRAALRNFAGVADEFNAHVPFFLRLREYVGRPLPTPAEFLDSAAAVLAPEAGNWPSWQLRSGKAFVLVDGLDEIPEGQRPEVINWLRQLAQAFPYARYVVTSRPGAVDPDVLAEEGFVTAELEPMPPALVRVFVDRWHAAMRGFLLDTAALERLADCQAELLHTLDNDRFVGELANTPLLAGLICALNHHLDGELPRRRGEIYEEALKMFHKRDRKRKTAADIDLDLDATNHLLSDLALWMVRNAQTELADEPAGDARGSMVSSDTARRVLDQSALSLPSRPSESADLYRHLLLRSGVLREPTAGHVDFVHRTFQEYLAAKALIRNDSVNELVRNAADDQWREIVILASGLCGTTTQANALLRGLVRPGWFGRQRYRRRLLAVASLDEVRYADHTVLKQIENAIPELLPPRYMAQAEALSHAGGDRLIPQLVAATKTANPHDYPFIIRAAALTGGPGALDLLTTVAGTLHGLLHLLPWPTEMQEFMRAWSYFDPEQYAEKVITALDTASVDVADLRCLRGVSRAPSVSQVTVTGPVSDSLDITALDGLTAPELTIRRSSISAITGNTRNPARIRRIKFDACDSLVDIRALFQLPDLHVVEVMSCPAFAGDDSARIDESWVSRTVGTLGTGRRQVDLHIGFPDDWPPASEAATGPVCVYQAPSLRIFAVYNPRRAPHPPAPDPH